MKETKWPERLGDTIKALMELTPEKAALPMYDLLCNIYRMEPKVLEWRDKAKQLDELVVREAEICLGAVKKILIENKWLSTYDFYKQLCAAVGIKE